MHPMTHDEEDAFWKSFLEDHAALSEAETWTPEEAEVRVPELVRRINEARPKIERHRAEIRAALAGMRAMVDGLAELHTRNPDAVCAALGAVTVDDLRAQVDRLQGQQDEWDRLKQKADLVVAQPKDEA